MDRQHYKDGQREDEQWTEQTDRQTEHQTITISFQTELEGQIVQRWTTRRRTMNWTERDRDRERQRHRDRDRQREHQTITITFFDLSWMNDDNPARLLTAGQVPAPVIYETNCPRWAGFTCLWLVSRSCWRPAQDELLSCLHRRNVKIRLASFPESNPASCSCPAERWTEY